MSISAPERTSENALQNPNPQFEGPQDSVVELKREMTWKDAFWFSSGVPALVLFSIGSIGATVGNVSWLVWTISIFYGVSSVLHLC